MVKVCSLLFFYIYSPTSLVLSFAALIKSDETYCKVITLTHTQKDKIDYLRKILSKILDDAQIYLIDFGFTTKYVEEDSKLHILPERGRVLPWQSILLKL